MLQRLLVERIEHRILVGTVAFLTIMVLVGWIAINENGRMQAFDRQFTARSTERGASMFNTNCSSCHGEDGRGNLGVAPALNSPYLFGHDFLAQVNGGREPMLAEQDALIAERDSTDAPPTAERAAEIGERLLEIETALVPLQAEYEAIIAQLQPAIDLGYDPENPSRLVNLGYGGTLNSFVYTTLVHGRPTSSSYWPQAMGAWSQIAGGPLRSDQLNDLTTFILNWDRGDDWTIDDALAVRQYPKVPIDAASVVMGEPVVTVGTDVPAIVTTLASLPGDPVSGQSLYNGARYACAGCHSNAAVAPPTENTYPALLSGERLADPALAGYTPDQYLVESIVAPNTYIVPGYAPGAMPQNFGERLSAQELADIIAYIKSYDGDNTTASADGG